MTFQILDSSEASHLIESVLETIGSDKSTTSLPNDQVEQLKVLLKTELTHHRLILGEVDFAKRTLEQSRVAIEGMAGAAIVSPLVNASFYRVSAEYDKVNINCIHSHLMPDHRHIFKLLQKCIALFGKCSI